jgi:glutamate--cysteine ligase
MQTISGVHYNFSLPEPALASLQGSLNDGDASERRTAGYFALIRNFRRHSWLPLYLFGASPAVCRSFVAGRPHRLQPLSGDTLYMPHATSLRMGPLGYQSDAQRSLAVSYNDLAHYASSLHQALSEPTPSTRPSVCAMPPATTASSRRRCCRSRTSSTGPFDRSDAFGAASGRCMR